MKIEVDDRLMQAAEGCVSILRSTKHGSFENINLTEFVHLSIQSYIRNTREVYDDLIDISERKIRANKRFP